MAGLHLGKARFVLSLKKPVSQTASARVALAARLMARGQKGKGMWGL